jgi:hypothetical protein
MESLCNSHKQSFGEVNFGAAQLGDARRTKRLIKLANQMVRHPGGTLPHKLRNPADLVALYRLCERDEVTHRAVLIPHQQVTLEKIAEHPHDVLVLHDSTDMDYTRQKSLTKLGQIGDGHGRGYIVQNSLAVCGKTGQVIGLTNQILHRRAIVSKTETRHQRRQRQSRESRLWVQGTKGLPAERKLIDVVDRGGDTCEFIEHEVHSGRRFVIRSQHNRRIVVGHATPSPEELKKGPCLHDFVRTLPSQGTFELDVTKSIPAGKSAKARKKNGKLKHPPRTARLASMCFSVASVQVVPPRARSGKHGRKPLPVWVVRVWEQSPPEGEQALEWILITNENVLTPQDALRVIGWYRKRWIIEEYHKAQKTGCNVESLHFQYEERLQPMIALLSIVALTLLRLRDAARAEDAKTRPAHELIGDEYVAALSLWRHREIRSDWSVHDFILNLGRMGGHLNRKRDGLPGWITLWRGWTELQNRVDTAELLNQIHQEMRVT